MAAERLAALIEAQRPHLALWIPVLFASGIGVYFSVPVEPQGWMLASLGAVLAMGVATVVRVGAAMRVALLVLLLPMAGFGAASLRSRAVAAPVLPYPMMANVEGRVVGLDRSSADRARVLLDRVVIHGLDPVRTPGRVRISVDPSTPAAALQPGLRLMGYARLSPPPAPAEPGGFDFRRMAWFEGLGAVGYTRTPMLETWSEGGRDGWRQQIFALRMRISRSIQMAIPGRNGGFASAILTGDRSGVDPGAVAALRASNLAHLLAISGLHMGLLTGFVFALIRYGLALIPRIALGYPIKKIAAMVALTAGAAYLLLSGANVATQRAFVMTAVVLIAVLIDRPAFTLRSVALAAMVVLAFTPGGADRGRVPDVVRGDRGADRRLRGAARAGLVARGPVRALALPAAGDRRGGDILGGGAGDGPDLGVPFQHHVAVRAAGQRAGGAGDGAGGDARGGAGRACWRRWGWRRRRSGRWTWGSNTSCGWRNSWPDCAARCGRSRTGRWRACC